MKCPECGEGSRVIETVPYSDRVRRRRECRECGHRWTTNERRQGSGDRDELLRAGGQEEHDEG